MLISEKVLEKEFNGRTTKEAYLNCCKWLSTNIIAVNNSKNITYKTEKINTDSWSKTIRLKTIRLTVYVTADEEEVHERHCNICKEVSGSFFMSENKYMCEVCKVPPYRRRLKNKLESMKEALKGKIL